MTAPVDAAAVRTYRYLRVGIVLLAVLLGVGVALQMAGDTGFLGSISAYYYSPARNVFVGVLVAVGLALVAIKGRGAEDALLNGAGILAPVVAVVPTPLPDGEGGYAVPPQVRDGVVSDVTSLLVVAVLALGFATWTAIGVTDPERPPARRGLAGAAAVVLVLGGWFTVHRDSFVEGAHFVAAIALFGVFVVVAWASATQAEERTHVRPAMLTAHRRAVAYRAISVGMLAISVLAVVLGVLQVAGHEPFGHWLFWVETALLVQFVAFWVLQTVEFWDDGCPA